jgi:Fungal specific transcription factor domain
VLSNTDLKQDLKGHYCSGRPVGIEAAVFALASHFIFLDDELSVSKGYLELSTMELWAIAHRGYLRSVRFSHLSSLQLCLLLLQMPPRNFAVAEPPSTWALCCSALSIAESLGVNLDPTNWRLPANEIRLRKRLWWLTYTQHTWNALLLGRPSHLDDDNWDVSKLTNDDFDVNEGFDEETHDCIELQIPILLALCDLSIIADQVLKEL